MLSALIWLPVVGSILIGVLPNFSRSIALIVSGVSLIVSIAVAAGFDYQAGGLQFVEYFTWIEPLGLD